MSKSLPKKCHFIGIGGIGMSALARLLVKEGIQVSGSDIASSYTTEALKALGVQIFLGHKAELISPDMTVVYSSDIKKENPEFQAALSLKCPLWHRSDLLQALMVKKKGLAVAGTHGKTTTTSLLTAVLLEANLDPTFVIGGILEKLKTNSSPGEGDYFIAEADESDGTFLRYTPFGSIVTNIDLDHMNHYETDAALVNAFSQYMSKVQSKKHLLWCGDDERLFKLKPEGVSYGFSDRCQWKITNFRQTEWSISFDAEYSGKKFSGISVGLTGRHNALNAMAVFALCLQLGIEENIIRKALSQFQGVRRRCEKKGEVNGTLFLDDYAHHPTEIVVTLKAIKTAIGKKRLIAVFQPHRYSRTKDCLGTYGLIFDEADQLLITDIYASGEAAIPGLTHDLVRQEIVKAGKPCDYVPRSQIAEYLLKQITPDDVVVGLGAGDITHLANEVDKLHVKKDG